MRRVVDNFKSHGKILYRYTFKSLQSGQYPSNKGVTSFTYSSFQFSIENHLLG